MVEISSQDEKCIQVGCLQLTDVVIQFRQCLTAVVVVGVGRDLNSNKQDGHKLPRKIVWPAFDNHKFHKGRAVFADHNSFMAPALSAL